MNIDVFTDGGCKSNGKLGATGAIGIHFPNKEFNDISEKYTSTDLNKVTNQRAELYAIYKAISLVSSVQFNKLYVYTDSKYSIDCLTKWIKRWQTNGWITSKKQPVMNMDLIKPIDELLTKYKNKVEFIHVPSHTRNMDYKSVGNRIADKLVKEHL